MPKQIPNVISDPWRFPSVTPLHGDIDEKAAMKYMEYTHSMPFAVVKHLVEAVHNEKVTETTWELLSQLPLLDWSTLKRAFLEKLVVINPVEMVRCLTRLLNNWSTLPTVQTDKESRSMCSQEVHTAVFKLDTPAVPLLVLLEYYEQAAEFTVKTSLRQPLVPPLSFVYQCVAQADPSMVSRLANILFLLRNLSLESPTYKQAVIEVCNALWSNRRLQLDPVFLESLSSLARFPVTIDSVFGLTMSPALSHIAAMYMWSLEDNEEIERRHEGPVTAQSLVANALRGGLKLTNQEFKQGFLDYAAHEYGLVGLRDFFYVTMRSLKRGAQDNGESEKRSRLENE